MMSELHSSQSSSLECCYYYLKGLLAIILALLGAKLELLKHYLLVKVVEIDK